MALPRYVLMHDTYGRGNRYNDLHRAIRELQHCVPVAEWYVYDRIEKRRMVTTEGK